MIPDINDLTWQSLRKYIERRITGIQNALQLIQQNAHVSNLAESATGVQHQLELLRWCLPFVNEMQNREDMQVVRPIMSLEIIRLSCRNAPAHSPDFAWILPIADGRFTLKQINLREPEKAHVFEGDLRQIIEKIEGLVKEICVQENQ